MKLRSDGANKVIINTQSPITITPPPTARYGERFIFQNFDPDSHVINVRELPTWFSAGDYVEYRKRRIIAVSISQTEPRWRQLLRRIRQVLK